MSRKNKHQKNQKGKGTTLANQADRYVLYEKAVQCVEAEIDMVDETFQSLRSRTARILREDFCGTANTSCEWVQRRDDNQAYAVDLDKKVIRWGEKHNIAKLNDDAASRIHLLNDDVLTVDVLPADMVLAMNFSYQIFKTRSQLRRSEEHTSELQSQAYLVCRPLLATKKKNNKHYIVTCISHQ